MTLLFRYIRKYQRTLLAALFLAVINQGFSLLDPQIFRLIIDRYATQFHELPGEVFIRGVLFLLLASIGVALVSRIAKSFQDYYVNVVTQRVGTAMYADSVSHAFALPFGVFEDQRSGEILEKLQRARDDSQTLLSNFINIVFLSAVGAIFVLIYAFVVHWLIGLALVSAIPILGLITYLISRKVKAAQRKIVRESTGLAGATTETLRNVELVKSLGLENQETERLNRVNEKILDLELVKVKLIRTLLFIQGTMVNMTRTALLFLMLWLIFRGLITLGEFFTIMFYSFAIFSPLYDLGTVITQYQEARASMEALDQVLKIAPEPLPESPKTIQSLKEIAFKDVAFQYQSADQFSVVDLNLTIPARHTVAFVGPSGSGKTTIMKLIVSLYRPSRGQLLFNGVDVREIDRNHLRQRIGYVSQDTQLFHGTIRENLLFVQPTATDTEYLAAIQAAAANSIIERSDQGLDTKIGEGGIKISGGERQRLAIARALLRNPELIIFDEATSSLDSITEKSITETIRHISKTRRTLTTILVAHRLSTVLHADMIYVLERGRVVESGNHQALLKKRGLYAALWREQGSEAEDRATITEKR